MTPIARRVTQALLYEVGAIAITSPILGLGFGAPVQSALILSALMSAIALTWNYVFNAFYERWEARQAVKGRSFARRVVHGLGFECGLVLMLVPLMAYWLDTTLLAALIAELGILVVFLVYAVGFTWAFDKVFGPPQSALQA